MDRFLAHLKTHLLAYLMGGSASVFVVALLASTGIFGLLPAIAGPDGPRFEGPSLPGIQISVPNPFGGSPAAVVYTEDPVSAPLGVMESPKQKIKVNEPVGPTTPGNPLRISGTFEGNTDQVRIEIRDAKDTKKVLFTQVVKPRKAPGDRTIFSSSIAWSKEQDIEVRISVLDADDRTEHVRFHVRVVEPLAPVVNQ